MKEDENKLIKHSRITSLNKTHEEYNRHAQGKNKSS